MAFQPEQPHDPNDDPLRRAAEAAGHPVDDPTRPSPLIDEIGVRYDNRDDLEKRRVIHDLVCETLEQAGFDTSRISVRYQPNTSEEDEFISEQMKRVYDPELAGVPISRASREWALNYAVAGVVALTQCAGANRTSAIKGVVSSQEAETAIQAEFLLFAEAVQAEFTIEPHEKAALIQAAITHSGIRDPRLDEPNA